MGRSSLHASALVGSLGVVDGEVGVEVGLHLVDGLVPFLAAHDAEVLVEQGSVQALDKAVGLRALDLCGAVLDLLELEEQLIRVPVGPAAELPAVIGEHRGDARAVCSKVGRTSVFKRCTAVTGILLG